MESLSDEILLHILSFLPLQSVYVLAKTSKRWWSLCSDPVQWKERLLSDYPTMRRTLPRDAPWRREYAHAQAQHDKWFSGMTEHLVNEFMGEIAFAIHAEDDRVFSGVEEGSVCLTQLATGQVEMGPSYGHAIRDLFYHSTSDRLVTAYNNGAVHVSRWCEGLTAPLILRHYARVNRVKAYRLSQTNFDVVSGTADGRLSVWDVSSGSLRGEQARAHEGDVFCMETAADRALLLSGGLDWRVKLHDVRTWECSATIKCPSVVNALAMPEGANVVFAALDESDAGSLVLAYDLRKSERVLARLPGLREGSVLTLVADSYNHLFASNGKHFVVWDVHNFSRYAITEIDSFFVCASVTPSADRVLAHRFAGGLVSISPSKLIQ